MLVGTYGRWWATERRLRDDAVDGKRAMTVVDMNDQIVIVASAAWWASAQLVPGLGLPHRKRMHA